MHLRILKMTLILLLLGNVSCFAGVKGTNDVADRLSRCEEKWCLSVAGPTVPWPSPPTGKTITIEEHPAVTFEIPVGYTRIRSVDYLRMFVYEKNKVLILEEISKEAFPELRENTQDSRMTMAEAGHATFTKTTKDSTPDCPADAKFWQWAMFLKMAFFEENVPVFISRNKSLTLYYLSKKKEAGVMVNQAVIVNDNSPQYILKLKSLNMSLYEFKSILGSTKEKW